MENRRFLVDTNVFLSSCDNIFNVRLSKKELVSPVLVGGRVD